MPTTHHEVVVTTLGMGLVRGIGRADSQVRIVGQRKDDQIVAVLAGTPIRTALILPCPRSPNVSGLGGNPRQVAMRGVGHPPSSLDTCARIAPQASRGAALTMAPQQRSEDTNCADERGSQPHPGATGDAFG